MRPDRTNHLVRSDLCSCLLRVEGQSFSPVLAVYFVGMLSLREGRIENKVTSDWLLFNICFLLIVT